MHELAGLLDGPRARGAFLIRGSFRPPWSIRVADRAPLSVMVQLDGEACIRAVENGELLTIRPGDVAFARGPEPYVVADRPDTEPRVEINADLGCTPLDAEAAGDYLELDGRGWGNRTDGPPTMLIGTYGMTGAPDTRVPSGRTLPTDRLLWQALPVRFVVRREIWQSPVVEMLGAELERETPGQDVMLDRMLDLLVVSALRAWLARPESEAPAWYRALSDPIVGRGMRLLRDRPGDPWTVATLAREVGASRAAFAERFRDLVGEPPMTYLTHLRIGLATELLADRSLTLEQISRRVGYGTPFALSAAFKRIVGTSPARYRETATPN